MLKHLKINHNFLPVFDSSSALSLDSGDIFAEAPVAVGLVFGFVSLRGTALGSDCILCSSEEKEEIFASSTRGFFAADGESGLSRSRF